MNAFKYFLVFTRFNYDSCSEVSFEVDRSGNYPKILNLNSFFLFDLRSFSGHVWSILFSVRSD